jgi:hypothetical protein
VFKQHGWPTAYEQVWSAYLQIVISLLVIDGRFWLLVPCTVAFVIQGLVVILLVIHINISWRRHD